MQCIRLSSLLLLLSMPLSAYPATVDGIEIPDQVTPVDGGPVLQLNGAGVRTKFFFTIYVGALYIAQPESDAARLLQTLPANRVLMQFVYRKVDKKKMDETWREGFARSTDAAGIAALGERVERFTGMFGDMRKGDTVWLDYVPASGTTISINGTPRGTIQGADFNRALLGVWLGAEPVSEALKNALVGVDNR